MKHAAPHGIAGDSCKFFRCCSCRGVAGGFLLHGALWLGEVRTLIALNLPGTRALGGFDDDGAGLLPTSCWDAGIAGKMQGARSAKLSNTRNSNGLAKEIGEGQQMCGEGMGRGRMGVAGGWMGEGYVKAPLHEQAAECELKL